MTRATEHRPTWKLEWIGKRIAVFACHDCGREVATIVSKDGGFRAPVGCARCRGEEAE